MSEASRNAATPTTGTRVSSSRTDSRSGRRRRRTRWRARSTRMAAARRSGTPSARRPARSGTATRATWRATTTTGVESDLDLMQDLGLGAYRFSIAWPRIQPDRHGRRRTRRGSTSTRAWSTGCSSEASDPSRRCTTGTSRSRSRMRADGRCARPPTRSSATPTMMGTALGDRVHTWTTLNEPWCSAYLGYGSGRPRAGSPRTGCGARRRAPPQPRARAGRAGAPGDLDGRPRLLGDAQLPRAARRGRRARHEAMRRIDALANRAFTGPMLRGEYPADLLEDTASVTDWSFVQDGDLDAIHQPIDVLGVNYYSTATVRLWDGVSPQAAERRAQGRRGRHGLAGQRQAVEFVEQPGPYTAMGWNIAPEGLEELLVSLREQFPEQPLMVTENGAAFEDVVADDGSVPDAGAPRLPAPPLHRRAPGHAARRRPARLLRVVAAGQLRVGLRLRQAVRHRARRLRLARAHREGQRPVVRLARAPGVLPDDRLLGSLVANGCPGCRGVTTRDK